MLYKIFHNFIHALISAIHMIYFYYCIQDKRFFVDVLVYGILIRWNNHLDNKNAIVLLIYGDE